MRRDPLPLRKPPPIIPPEYLYFTASLKQICASLILRKGIPVQSLPEDLRLFVEEVKEGGSLPFLMKPRACAAEDLAGAINVGRFQEYPEILMEPQPTPGKVFATDIIAQASAVVQFLSTLDKNSLLKIKSVLERALHFRYFAFLNLQGNLSTRASFHSNRVGSYRLIIPDHSLIS